MSSSDAGDRPGREVAHRLFATEFDDASVSYAQSDEERAPNYVISPTGARLNRVFVVGTLTEVTDVNEEMVRARVVDPTGAFVVYAGQYQPDALAFLERAEPPAFVAVTGKARTFEPDDGDRVYTSIRPESLATVDSATRDRWVVDTAEHTLSRIGTYAAAVSLDATGDDLATALRANGVENGFAEGIGLALEHYGTTAGYLDGLRQVVLEAVRVVAGEQSQVSSTTPAPVARLDGGPDYDELAADGPSLTLPARLREATDAADADDVATETDPSAGAAIGTAEAGDSASSEATTDDGGSKHVDDNVTDTTTADSDASVESEPTETDADDEPERAIESDAVDAEESGDDHGDVDAAEAEDGDGAEADDSDELGDFEGGDGMYEFDDEEREAIEQEYGTDFTTGTEVDDPGEADIDVPDPEGVETAAGDDEPSPADGDGATDDPELSEDGASDAAADDGSAEDVDLQARVVEAMDDLDDGEGAERDAVVEVVAEATGATSDAVEQAIQDALMGGECFEPSEDRLQAI